MTARNSARPRGPRSDARVAGLFLVLMMALVGIGGRLVQVQGIQSRRFAALGAVQRERKVEVPARRGSIFDRDGAELALSLERDTVVANPRGITDPRAAAVRLGAALGVPASSLESRLASDRAFVYVSRKVDPLTSERVARLGVPTVDFISESKRFYPNGSLAANVLGFVGMDNGGLAGLEDAYDTKLAGRPGEVLIERDPRGRVIPTADARVRRPLAGEDLMLTIDREIQYAAELALARAMTKWSAVSAVAIVMDPRSGEVLAMANNPSFDPNDVSTSDPEDRRNRALTSLYEPGSIQKLVTAAAALESKVVSPETRITAPDTFRTAGKTFHDWKPHPTWDLTFSQVMEFSSNVGVIQVAQRLGAERLHRYLEAFGYGRPTGIGFPSEPAGLLPEVKNWWTTSLPTIAIGQGVAVTPLQIVSAYAAVANDGVYVGPRLVKGRMTAGGFAPSAAPPRRRVVSERTAQTLARILTGVTENEFGTGKAAAIPGYHIAGKTATAQIPKLDGRGYSDAIVGSFIGFAPATDPQVAIGVMLEDPKPSWGGFTAGATFKEIMEFSLRHLGIGPGPVLPREGAPLPAPGRSGDAAVALPAP